MHKLNFLLDICLIATVLGLSFGERARYDNYRVYKLIASSEKELEVLKNLEGSSDSLIFLDGVHIVGRDVEVVVAPHKVPDFLTILGTNKIEYQLVESNMEKVLEKTYDEIAPRASAYGWTQYYTLDDNYAWLRSLASTYPGIVTLIEGGKTYQGRSILGVKIDHSKGSKNNPGIFLEAGIHAREWIAPATATFIINELLTSTDSNICRVANNYVWYIFPHTNPDGYVYTHTIDRFWRKTRAPYGICYGADPNRNWGFHWNEVGASNNPCSDTYAGPSAFSEIETKSLSTYMESLKEKIHLYISFHSYSQYLLYPYGHTSDLPDNSEDMERVYNVSVAAIGKRYGTKYTGGNIHDAIYPVAGGSIDWVYAKLRIKMAFVYELRPSSSSFLTGFRLPADQIVPTGEETLDSIIAMIGEVNRLGYF